TDVEALLWRRLRNRQVANFKFRRQHPWGTYILDFFCPAAKVAIELDGEWHEGTLEADQERDTDLAAHGITVLRYWNRARFWLHPGDFDDHVGFRVVLFTGES
ncbi:MAG: DUF559 domain-containing protein, partial [bacterium]|nr:DUF559 domain-containing protein [bacterium]